MTGFILSIVLIPIVILLNSLFIGKIVRRFSVDINAYIATSIGFLIYLATLFLFFSLLYIFIANVLTYLIFFLVIQSILVILYILNYRYLIISYKIQIKQMILFGILLLFIVGALCLIILVAYHDQPMSNSMKILTNYFHDSFTKYSDTVKFYDDQFTFKNFSVLIILAATFKPLFGISNNWVTNFLL
jgi:hypothetical protein